MLIWFWAQIQDSAFPGSSDGKSAENTGFGYLNNIQISSIMD
jgi:hypothetical protein